MFLKLGNLSPERFAERVGSEFTDDELTYLRSVWSQKAALVGPDDFHIFDDPTISAHIGSATSRTVEVFKAANARSPFDRAVQFSLDDDWESGDVA